MEVIKTEFDVPIKYMKVIDGRISLTVHRNWLASFFIAGPISFIIHDKLTADEIAAQPTLEELGSDWTRIYAKVFLLIYIFVYKYRFDGTILSVYFNFRSIQSSIKMLFLYLEEDVPLIPKLRRN